MFKTPTSGAFWAFFGKVRISQKTELRQFLTLTELDFMQRIKKKDTELETNAYLCAKLKRERRTCNV